MHECLYICACVYVCACLYLNVCISVWVCLYLCVCVCVYENSRIMKLQCTQMVWLERLLVHRSRCLHRWLCILQCTPWICGMHPPADKWHLTFWELCSSNVDSTSTEFLGHIQRCCSLWELDGSATCTFLTMSWIPVCRLCWCQDGNRHHLVRCPDALEVELCMMMTFCFQNCKGQRTSLLYVYIYMHGKKRECMKY